VLLRAREPVSIEIASMLRHKLRRIGVCAIRGSTPLRERRKTEEMRRSAVSLGPRFSAHPNIRSENTEYFVARKVILDP
jgi:hypothetical protein